MVLQVGLFGDTMAQGGSCWIRIDKAVRWWRIEVIVVIVVHLSWVIELLVFLKENSIYVFVSLWTRELNL